MNAKSGLKGLVKGVKQWFDGLTIQSLLKFILLLVILHLVVFFFRPLPIHITHKSEKTRSVAMAPMAPRMAQPAMRAPQRTIRTQPPTKAPKSVKRSYPSRTVAPTRVKTTQPTAPEPTPAPAEK